MKVRHKESGAEGSSSQFNVHTAAPQEIIVAYADDLDTDYLHDFDVEIDGQWVDMMQAFAERRLIVDNLNTRFFEPENDLERRRGFRL